MAFDLEQKWVKINNQERRQKKKGVVLDRR